MDIQKGLTTEIMILSPGEDLLFIPNGLCLPLGRLYLLHPIGGIYSHQQVANTFSIVGFPFVSLRLVVDGRKLLTC